VTGFKTFGAFVRETSVYERRLIVRSIEEWHEAQSDGGGGAGGLPPGL
jgi:hypothetical protein